MNKKKSQAITKLFEAVLSLNNIDECYSFFEDACTIQELNAIAQRFEVATLISQGKSYSEVNKITGASTTTICRVGKCINYGEGGYRTVIERLNKENENK